MSSTKKWIIDELNKSIHNISVTCRLQFSLPILTEPLLPNILHLPEYGINPKSSCHVNPTDLSPVCTKFQQHNCYLVNLTDDLGFGVGSSGTDIKMNQALPSHASFFVKYMSANITDSYIYTNRNTECLVTAACKMGPSYHSKCFKFSAMRPSSVESETETRTNESHPSNKIQFSVECKAVSSTIIFHSS
jgi:hypothetical protein